MKQKLAKVYRATRADNLATFALAPNKRAGWRRKTIAARSDHFRFHFRHSTWQKKVPKEEVNNNNDNERAWKLDLLIFKRWRRLSLSLVEPKLVALGQSKLTSKWVIKFRHSFVFASNSTKLGLVGLASSASRLFYRASLWLSPLFTRHSPAQLSSRHLASFRLKTPKPPHRQLPGQASSQWPGEVSSVALLTASIE